VVTGQILFDGAESRSEQTMGSDVRTSDSTTLILAANSSQGVVCA